MKNKKVKILMIMVWVFVLLITIFLSVKYPGNLIQIFTPIIGLLLISVIEYFAKLQAKSRIIIFLRRTFATPFLILGFNWISIFTMTTYRSHHRPVIIPLAIVFLAIGLTLTHYKIYDTSLDK